MPDLDVLINCPKCGPWRERSGETPPCDLCYGTGEVTVDRGIDWKLREEKRG